MRSASATRSGTTATTAGVGRHYSIVIGGGGEWGHRMLTHYSAPQFFRCGEGVTPIQHLAASAGDSLLLRPLHAVTQSPAHPSLRTHTHRDATLAHLEPICSSQPLATGQHRNQITWGLLAKLPDTQVGSHQVWDDKAWCPSFFTSLRPKGQGKSTQTKLWCHKKEIPLHTGPFTH